MFTTAQLRVFLRALVNLAPYTFADDVAERFAAEDENDDKSAEEILLATVDGLTDDKLTGFALRLVLTANTPIPREGEVDSLTEAETAFVPVKPKKTAKAPMPMKAATKTASKKSTAKKQAAAKTRSASQPICSRSFPEGGETMFQFTYKLKIAERVKAQCCTEPRLQFARCSQQ
jgi:ParB family chromosome partitioning protein